jgi:NADH:ubiquinone oxidoreductase subunit K
MPDAFLSLNIGAALSLFVLGLAAAVQKRSLIRIVLGMEIMGKGVTLTFVTAGFALDRTAMAQAFVFIVIAIEVVVTAIALALMIRVQRTTGRLDVSAIRRLHG